MALEYIMGAMKSQWLSIKLSHIRERYSQKKSPWWTTGKNKEKIYIIKIKIQIIDLDLLSLTWQEWRICVWLLKNSHFSTWFHLKTSTLNNWFFFSCLFLNNILNHTTKAVNFHVFQMILRKKILNHVLPLMFYFLFAESSNENKGLFSRHVGSWHFFLNDQRP